MVFWDANCSYGTVKVPLPGVDYSLSGLLRRMEEYGIEKALVYHSTAKEHDAAVGNRRLMEETAGHSQIMPVWTLLPHYAGEMEKPDVLVENMLKAGVKAATMFPSAAMHNFSAKRWSIGPLLDALAERRIPLIMGIEQLGGMEGMGEFAMENPNLAIIATNVHYRVDRILYALMDKAPNLYVETSFYKSYFGLQEFAGRFGTDRLVFGSCMPSVDPAASAAVVMWSGLNDAEKEAIAHGNLQRLLGEVR